MIDFLYAQLGTWKYHLFTYIRITQLASDTETSKMWSNTPLTGIKVVEFAGLAPAPFAGSEPLALF